MFPSRNLISCAIIFHSLASPLTVLAQDNCTIHEETIECLDSFVKADTDNDGQLTSYEYIDFANGMAGGDVFAGFPVPLLLSFSYLSCLCKKVGDPEDCCTKGRPYISLAGAQNPYNATPMQKCFFNEICSVTGTAVVDANPFVTPTGAPTRSVPTEVPSGVPTKVATNAPTKVPTASPIVSASLANSELFSGQIPLSFVYGMGNNAGLSGTDIFLGTDGNRVKNDLIGATSKLAVEVANKTFGEICEGENVFGGCGSRGLRNTKRSLRVSINVDILPTIDQAISIPCPDSFTSIAQMNITESLNITNYTNVTTPSENATELISISNSSNITSVTLRTTNVTDEITLNTTSIANSTGNNNETANSTQKKTTNNTIYSTSCANIISTIVLELVEESSPVSEIRSKFLTALLDEIKRGRLQDFLPEDSVVTYVGGQISLGSPQEATPTNKTIEITPSSIQSTPETKEDNGGGLSTLAIALIAVGAGVGVIAIVVVGFFVMKKENNYEESDSGDESYEEVEIHVVDEGESGDDGREQGRELGREQSLRQSDLGRSSSFNDENDESKDVSG